MGVTITTLTRIVGAVHNGLSKGATMKRSRNLTLISPPSPHTPLFLNFDKYIYAVTTSLVSKPHEWLDYKLSRALTSMGATSAKGKSREMLYIRRYMYIWRQFNLARDGPWELVDATSDCFQRACEVSARCRSIKWIIRLLPTTPPTRPFSRTPSVTTCRCY